MLDLEQYRQILESSPNMVWRSNLTTECDYFNKTWLDFTGRTMNQELGFGWAESVHPEDFDRCVKIYLEGFSKQQQFEMDYRMMRNDGQYRWINDRGVPFYDQGVFLGFIGSCMDITDKVEGQLLKTMAQTDALCQTYNRQYALQLMKDIFEASEDSEKTVSLLMMDVDDFKGINDQYGHVAGDTLLAAIGRLTKKELRGQDILGRYGGDEFLIALEHTDQEAALAVAKRINKAIAQYELPIPNMPAVGVTVSIGVKTRVDEKSLDELIARVDEKLYEAKREGKNLVKW